MMSHLYEQEWREFQIAAQTAVSNLQSEWRRVLSSLEAVQEFEGAEVLGRNWTVEASAHLRLGQR